MKLVIDIKDSNVQSFIDLMKEHNFVKSVTEIKDVRKSRFMRGLKQSFKEVKLYQQGKRELKNAKDLINELRSQGH